MNRYDRFGLGTGLLWGGAGELRQELFNLLDSFGLGGKGGTSRFFGLPRISVDETEDGFVVKAALPGYDPDKVEVEVLGDCLTIRGERFTGVLGEGERYIHRERTADHMEETLRLPSRIDPEKVCAELKNGVLTVCLTREEVKAPLPRKIKVQ